MFFLKKVSSKRTIQRYLFCCSVICADLRRTAPVPHARLVPHRGPAPRGPQEETSNRWWAAIRRRHCTAAESSVVFSDVFSDLTYAEHPSWRQTLATSRSHTEWASLSLSPRPPPVPPTTKGSRPPLRPSSYDDDDVEFNVLGCRVGIIIRDKLWPMRVHGSVLLYVHINPKAH